MKKEKTLVLLDAHAILHRAYHALPDFTSGKGEPTGALYGVSAMLLKIIKDLKPDFLVACYDLPKPTFRHVVYEDYKKGRAKTEDSLIQQIKRSREIFKAFNLPIYDAEGYEADDLLGTITEKLKSNKDIRIIIASGDMDTMQLIDKKRVQVYTLKKGLNDTILYDEDAVEKRFGFGPRLLPDYKGLRGDPSDNIPGIVGIGEKTATTLITSFGDIEAIYKKLKKGDDAFLKIGLKPRILNLLREGEEDAIFSKMLATIHLDAPIKFSLPNISWKEGVKLDDLKNIFIELDFRNMMSRVNNTLGIDTEDMKEKLNKENITEVELKQAGIMLWLLHSDTTNPTIEDILNYTQKDTFKDAVNVLNAKIKNTKLEGVYYDIEKPLISIIKKAEERGILVDILQFKNLSKDYHKKLSVLEKSIWKHAQREFNINSPKQLGEILFDEMNLSVKGLKKTASGARSTRESELVKLKDEHEIIESILKYRELQKLLSTYIDVIPNMVGGGGRLHANLNQTGTTTGRMSSNNPNMQNIPSKEGLGVAIREGFVAQKGYKFIAFDYSQIEMRILAELSKDKKLISIFKKGEDVHASVAAYVFNVKEKNVTKDMRRQAKVINFGIAYGMGITALKENLGSTRKEAQEFYDNYFLKFPAIKDYFESVKRGAREKGYTETFFGRKRHFQNIKSHIPFIRAMAERMAVNAPIQGTAADIIKLATIKADNAIKQNKLSDDVHLILQIHDELIFEVKDVVVEKVVSIIRKAMEDFPEISIPVTVNIAIGKSLYELKKSE